MPSRRREFIIGGSAFAAGAGLTALVLGRLKSGAADTPAKTEATKQIREEPKLPEVELHQAYNRFLDKYGERITQALADLSKNYDDYRFSSNKPEFRVDGKYIRDIKTVVGRIDFDTEAYMIKMMMDGKGYSVEINGKKYDPYSFAKIARKNIDGSKLRTSQGNLFVNRWQVPLFFDPDLLMYNRDATPDFAKINLSDPLESAKIYRTRTGQEAVLVQIGNIEYWAPLKWFDSKPMKSR